MASCSFCDRELAKGTGKMLVKNTGKVLYFCSGKCEKNLKLKRKPTHVRWSGLFKKEIKQQE
jgi:large subunit ribosomal protein L24e